MVQRDYQALKQLKQRRWGLMKKACELSKLCGVHVTVIIEDSGDFDVFKSEEDFPLRIQLDVGSHNRRLKDPI